jgi:hypothetical protein
MKHTGTDLIILTVPGVKYELNKSVPVSGPCLQGDSTSSRASGDLAKAARYEIPAVRRIGQAWDDYRAGMAKVSFKPPTSTQKTRAMVGLSD